MFDLSWSSWIVIGLVLAFVWLVIWAGRNPDKARQAAATAVEAAVETKPAVDKAQEAAKSGWQKFLRLFRRKPKA